MQKQSTTKADHFGVRTLTADGRYECGVNRRKLELSNPAGLELHCPVPTLGLCFASPQASISALCSNLELVSGPLTRRETFPIEILML